MWSHTVNEPTCVFDINLNLEIKLFTDYIFFVSTIGRHLVLPHRYTVAEIEIANRPAD